jgi:DNA polymerase V
MKNSQLVYLAKGKAGAPTLCPLYASQPAAGFPAPGDDLVERTLDLNDLLVKNPHATFYVRAQGDSMEGVGIFSGDILVVDRSQIVTPGRLVVAAVYGELVVKRYELQGNQPALCSANEGYAPIKVSESDDVHVWGVVVGSVRVW